MPSVHFDNLEKSIEALKQTYLNGGVFPPLPTPQQQELARAFAVLAHAEFEDYIESAFRDLSDLALNGIANGMLSRVAFSLLAFSGLPPQTGGAWLRMPTGQPAVAGGKKEKTPRQMVTRFGEAHGRYATLLSKNHGVREKYLSVLGVPIGLDAKKVDSTWITELGTFCDKRGIYAHHSRSNAKTMISTIDPKDIWSQCERLVWTPQSLASPGVISSFKDIDDWVEQEKTLIGAALIDQSAWRMKLLHGLSMWWQFWKRRGSKQSDDNED
jgi:hypothetical protein